MNLLEFDTGRCLKFRAQMTFCLTFPFGETIEKEEINIWSMGKDERLLSPTNQSLFGRTKSLVVLSPLSSESMDGCCLRFEASSHSTGAGLFRDVGSAWRWN